MKQPWMALLLVISVLFFTNTVKAENRDLFSTSTPETKEYIWAKVDDEDIENRLQLMKSPVTLQLDAVSKEYIQAYTTYGYKGTEKMLGKTAMYFPIFEHYLQIYQLPQQLKYLPLIESQLNPMATSTVGAAGLWQFMRTTGRERGLRVTTYLDERRDPHKSTEAAVRYLRKLHNEFNDWELALAAYNSGAGNIRKAIRLSGTRDYWKLKTYLPQETQKYISRFIAASYVAENYEYHGLTPRVLDYHLHFTTTTKIYSGVTFKKLASLSQVPLETIRRLNPAFKRQVIPEDAVRGHFLTLPSIGMSRFQAHLKYSNLITDLPEDATLLKSVPTDLRKSIYAVETGDTVNSIVKKFGFRIEELRSWNALRTDRLYPGQELIIYTKNRMVAMQ